MNLVYDVAHNIAKMEEHDGRRPAEDAVRASQGGDPGVSRRAIPKCPSSIARSASR